ncbi:MAG: hypothetical protein U1E25_02195 [Methylocystis sp.]
MRTQTHDAARTALQESSGCVNAVPALSIPKGFRLLALRCYHNDPEPPAFAWLNQRIFRTPERIGRHGLYFGVAFRPEIMDWLIARVGRPSSRESGKPQRNPEWPSIIWQSAERVWPDNMRTTEWSIDVVFASEDAASAFRARWRERLSDVCDA